MEVFRKLGKKYPRTFEILRFLLIGGIATAIELFIMSLIIYLPNKAAFGSFINVFMNKHIASSLVVTLGSAIGFIVGLAFNYVFSFKFVYKGENKLAKTPKGFLIFTVLSVIGLLIQTIGVFVGYSVFHINEWLVKVVLILVVLVFNYITRKIFLFKDSKKYTVQSEENIALTNKEKKFLTFLAFTALFVIYSVFSIAFVYCLDSISWQFIFGCDSPRVLADWTSEAASQYRTKVHPLYVLFVMPITYFLMYCGLNPIMAVVLLNALFSTLNTYLVYKILNKILRDKIWLTIILTIFYAVSFTVFENLMIIESFTISLFTILLFWCYFIYNYKDFKLNIKSCIILALLGMLCFSMLLVNYFHFLLGTLFLVVLNRKKPFKEVLIDIAKYLGIVALSMLISMVLIYIQKSYYPGTENAIKYVLEMFIDLFRTTKESEEYSYINFSINGVSFLNILVFFFGVAFAGGKVVNNIDSLIMHPNFLTVLMIIAMVCALGFSTYKIIKNKKWIAVPIAVAYLFEMVLHLFYGNNELMLYINQSSFLLIILIALGLSEVEPKDDKIVKISSLSILGVSIFQTIITCCVVFVEVFRKHGLSDNKILEDNSKFILVVLFAAAIAYAIILAIKWLKTGSLCNAKTVEHKWVGLLSLIFVSVLTSSIIVSAFIPKVEYVYVNTPPVYVQNDTVIEEPSIVMMGMGQRKKYVLEQSESGYYFYHYNTETKLKTPLYIELTDVSFDSLNYSIKCVKSDGKPLEIYENQHGIYLNDNGVLTTLDNSQYINIPSFHGYSQSNYLKILFYEVMVNVMPNGFTPNYLTYGNFWYRDGALMAMVLEATNNLSQMRLDVGVDDVYDGARGGVDEPDNLGELLYMLSLEETIKWDVVNAVLAEAERIKQPNDCISGYTDGGLLYVYQTKWLKFGMEKLGLDSSMYDVTDKTDAYSSMCWWYDRGKPSDCSDYLKNLGDGLFDIKRVWYPYLEIAQYHYYEYKIEMPNNLTYPISFEWQDWGLEQQAKCSPHSWMAAELFLYLLEYDNF